MTGNQVKELRENDLQTTQEGFANFIHCSSGTVSKLERQNDAPIPSKWEKAIHGAISVMELDRLLEDPHKSVDQLLAATDEGWAPPH